MMRVDKPEKSVFEFRVGFSFLIIFLAMSVLVVRLGYLQVKSGARFVQASRINEYDTMSVPPPRGWIYDRYHFLLAADRLNFEIVYTELASGIQDIPEMAAHLALPFGESAAKIASAMSGASGSGNLQVTILQNASKRAVSYVEEHLGSLPGLTVITAPVRYYPYGALGDHLLGYISDIPSYEANYYKAKNYLPNALVGMDGIEGQYEPYLQGTPGVMRVQVNVNNVPMRDLGLYPPPVPGDNLVLNIDGHLQNVLQAALKAQIASLQAGGSYWVHSGVAVAMDPNTGAVLAIGSYPSFNPQWFVGGISSANYQKYQSAALNKAVGGLYPPGSTEKPLTLMYALHTGVINKNTTVWDPGYFYVGNTRLNEWAPYGFGTVTVPQAIEKSSDVFLYQTGLWIGHYPPQSGSIGQWMSGERVRAFNGMEKFARSFGLTAPTGIDLPGEMTGLFHDNGYLSDLAYMAIGQDQAYTPIGLAQYVSAIANGGNRMQPEVLHEVLSPSGKVLKVIKPKLLNRIPVSAGDLALIREGMLWVTQKRNGTAWSTFLGEKYLVAGKTGTAQTGLTGRDIASFIGFAPFDHPKIAVAVVIPGAGEGYLSSGPVARAIIDAYLDQLAGKKPIPPTAMQAN